MRVVSEGLTILGRFWGAVPFLCILFTFFVRFSCIFCSFFVPGRRRAQKNKTVAGEIRRLGRVPSQGHSEGRQGADRRLREQQPERGHVRRWLQVSAYHRALSRFWSFLNV